MTSSTQTATLKTASDSSVGQQRIPCIFQEFRGKSLVLHFNEKPVTSGAVSVEYNDTMFLGEIVRSSAVAGGAWQMEIFVSQVLTGLESLLRFRSQLMGEGVGPAPQRAPRPIYALTA